MALFFLIAGAVLVGSQANRLLTAGVIAVIMARRERRALARLVEMGKADIQAVRRRKLECDCPSCSAERKLAVN